MDKEEIIDDLPKTRWSIDLDWYQRNNRSLSTMAQSCLCPKCAKQLSAKGKEISMNDLLSKIKDCCSRTPGFITDQSPILESIFRFFLANGNQPIDLEKLGKQLSEWRGGDTYRASPEILLRLLKSGKYYGLREVQT